MKRFLNLLFAMIAVAFSSLSTKAQNLVPNPSFENLISCPNGLDEMDEVMDWSSYRNSPDYFNSCASATVGIPINVWGHQQALDGNAYAFVASYDGMHPGNSYREFIGAQLTQALIPGTKYFVSAYVSRASSHLVNGASNNLGFRFSTISYSKMNPAPIDNFSHSHIDSIITDSINWNLISGAFIADSAYHYLILGNFYDDQNTDTIDVNNTAAGYYIDAICVTTDSLFNLNWVGVKNPNLNSGWEIVFPNPVANRIYVEGNVAILDYYIYDLRGTIVKTGVLKERHSEIDVSCFSNGLYILVVDNRHYYKIGINN